MSALDTGDTGVEKTRSLSLCDCVLVSQANMKNIYYDKEKISYEKEYQLRG